MHKILNHETESNFSISITFNSGTATACSLCQFLSQSEIQAQFIIPIVSFQPVTVFAGKERSDVGKIRGVIVNPCKSANESFGPLNSNSTNSPYVEPGKYILRSDEKSQRSQSTLTHKSTFRNMHGPKTVRKSEFEYFTSSEVKGSNTLAPFVDRPGGFYNKKTSDPFTSLN